MRPPKKSSPQLLRLPERDELLALAVAGAATVAKFGLSVPITTVELSLIDTIQHGHCKSLTLICEGPAGKPLDINHLMPVAATSDDYVAAADVLGKSAQAAYERAAFRMAMEDGRS